MPDASTVLTLRRSVLAACVLHDIDLDPQEHGVALRTIGGREVEISWSDLADRVAGWEHDQDTADWRVARTLQALALLDGPATHDVVAPRLVALPCRHADHPGGAWARTRVPGGALDAGIGLLGLGGDPDEVWPLPPTAQRLGLVPAPVVDEWWAQALAHAERMGELVVERLSTGPGLHKERGEAAGSTRPGSALLRPFGGVDVLGLLAVPTLRRYIAASDGTGMRAVAVPDRRRGWLDPSRIDPAFVGAAWTATDPPWRGIAVPLLVTADEVGAARPLGDVVAQALDLPRPWFKRGWSRPS